MPEGWVVRIRDVAGRTRHTGPTAPASLVAGPRTIVMRLANPIGIPTAGAFHSGIHVSTSLARGQARVRNRGQQKPRLGGRGFKVTNLRRSSLPVVACNGSENSRCALSALQSIRELRRPPGGVPSGSCFAQAVRSRRRHQARRPPPTKIRPGSPAPAIGPGTARATPIWII
jgi:hypothetical protein